MAGRNELIAKIRHLEEKVRLLELENSDWTDRAEDIFLVASVAEAIGGLSKKDEIFNTALEKTSIMKDIPYCAFGKLNNREVHIDSEYALFSEAPNIASISLLPTLRKQLQKKEVIVANYGRNNPGLTANFNGTEFTPASFLLIAFESLSLKNAVFICMDKESSERLDSMSSTLTHLVKLVNTRLDNLFLMEQLSRQNEILEQKVRERTRALEEQYQKSEKQRIATLSVLSDLSETTKTLKLEIKKRKKSEAALRKSEKFNKAIRETAADAIITIDSEGRVVNWNKAAEKIFGFRAQEMKKKKLTNIIPELYLDKHEKAIQKLNSGNPEKIAGKTVELRGRKKSGDEFPIEISLSGWTVGSQKYYTAIIRDISDRKKAEKEIRKFRVISDRAVHGMIIADLKGSIVYLNDYFARIHGYTANELIGKHISIFHDPKKIKSISKVIKRLLDEGMFSSIEVWHIHRNGNEFPMIMSGVVIPDENGNPEYMAATAIDITDLKQTEEALREKEEWNKEIFEGSRDAIFIVDTNARIRDVNRAATLLTGYSKNELLKMTIPDLHRQEDLEAYHKFFKRIINGESITSEAKIFRKNGTTVETEFSNKQVVIKGVSYMHTVARDITDRKRAEKIQAIQLNISRALVSATDLDVLFRSIKTELKPLLEIKNFVLTLYDEDTGLLRKLLDKDKKDNIPVSWKAEKSVTGQVVLQKKTILLTREEIKKLAEDGTIHIMGTLPEIWLGIPLFADGKIVGALVIQDYENRTTYDKSIVEFLQGLANQLGIYISRKKTEAERELLSAAIEQAAEAVLVTDTEGNIQYVNPAFEKISGYTRSEVLEKNPRILKSGKQDKSFYKVLWETITAGKVWRGKIVDRCKDGSLYTEECTISPVFDEEGKISNYVAVKRDITKEEELEQQFRQAQKMESIGRLAGGVAHDFNNMLSVIIGYSQLALAKLSSGDKLYKILQEILKAGQRSANLTSQLLAFSRKQTIDPQIINLNDAVNNMLKMLRRLIGENINLVWKPDTELWSNYMDATQVDQILANLCVNARDAINGPGRITIETKNVIIDDEYCRNHMYARPGDYVMLSVSDTGCGMDEQTKSRIFEPFFTTKAAGQGTGLGLATVYGIVKQNEGFVNVYSEPGEGTSFKLYFPRHKRVNTAENQTEKKLPTGRGEHILLVEDEPAILEMTQTMLESIGYSVISAKTPEEALRLVREKGDHIQLMMSDVVMPGMNGKELANELKTLHPEIKVLFMSGYTSDIIAHQGVLDKGINFITKPFSLPELAEKINAVLKNSTKN